MLGESNFLSSLQEFDRDHIPDAVIKKMQRYMEDPSFTPDAVAKQSVAAKCLCEWARAMVVYNR